MTDSSPEYNLQRFIHAQDPVIDRVKTELHNGRKQTHWMWFVFPQVEGLSKSSKSQKYAIKSREEAEAYIQHPVLGPRLRECTQIVVNTDNRSANDIFGHPDDLKFRSSMTLFEIVADDNTIFTKALDKYYDTRDEHTVEFLTSQN